MNRKSAVITIPNTILDLQLVLFEFERKWGENPEKIT